MSPCKTLNEECTFRSLTWSHSCEADFVLSQWRVTDEIDVCYVIYRWFHLLSLVLMFVIYGIVAFQDVITSLRALAFITTWSYLFCVLYSMYAAIYISKANRKKHLSEMEVSGSSKVLWILHNVAIDLTFSVTTLYWCGRTFSHKINVPLHSEVMHTWNSISMLMDFFMVSIPIRIPHVYASAIVGLFYAVFSYVYYYLGGLSVDNSHSLYPLLDWKNDVLVAVLVVLASFTVLMLLRVLIYLAYCVRCCLFAKLFPDNITS